MNTHRILIAFLGICFYVCILGAVLYIGLGNWIMVIIGFSVALLVGIVREVYKAQQEWGPYNARRKSDKI